ncbi:unnamed protein product, partial [Boreogadus saida]
DKPVGKPRQRCLPGKKGEERNSRCNSRGAALFDGSTHIKMLRSTEVLAGTSKCVHTFIQAGEQIFTYASILCTIGANFLNVEKL